MCAARREDIPYVFSGVKTRNANSYPPNATDGSGKTKLNFWKERARGGTKTPLVDVRSRIVRGPDGGGDGTDSAGGTAPAAPNPLIRSRRLMSDMRRECTIRRLDRDIVHHC